MLRPFIVLVALAALPLAGCIEAPSPAGVALPALPALACAAPGDCNALASTGAGFANEPSIAINPLDPLNVVVGAHEYGTPTRDVWPGVHVSRDGGATFTHGLLPGFPGDTSGAHPLTGYAVGGDPALAFAPDGTLYYAGIAFHRQLWNVALFVAMSPDGGDTWPQVTFVQRGLSTVVFNDKEYIAVDPATGDVHIVWTVFQFLPTTFVGVPVDPIAKGEIFHAKSTDKGATWSAPKQLSPGMNQGAVPAFDADGRLVVAWMHYASAEDATTLQVSVSEDGGATFSAPVDVAPIVGLPSTLPNTNFRVSSMPTLAADTSDGPHRGAVYVAWPDYATEHADVVMVKSTDGGKTWSAPARVNDDATETDQFMPWLAVDGRGRVHALYLDRSEDAENTLYHARLATSLDGGATWTSQRLSDGASDDRVARPTNALGQEGATFIGDYSGMAVSGDTVIPVWPDLRNSADGARKVDVYVQVVR